ncbi:MAG TPA: hypothetical protein PLH97_07635 [Verrucomicrobiota bacterium]|nr:hypothetical protein [Verrucomicrobiota bacterium]
MFAFTCRLLAISLPPQQQQPCMVGVSFNPSGEKITTILPPERETLQARIRLLRLQPLNVEHGPEDRVIHRHIRQRTVGKDLLHFAHERIAPFLAAASGAGEQESALLQIQLQVRPFFIRQRERALARHHGERKSEHFLVTQFHRLELPRRVDAGLGGHRGKEFLAETDRTLRAGIDEVGAFDSIAARVGSLRGCRTEHKSNRQLHEQDPQPPDCSNAIHQSVGRASPRAAIRRPNDPPENVCDPGQQHSRSAAFMPLQRTNRIGRPNHTNRCEAGRGKAT